MISRKRIALGGGVILAVALAYSAGQSNGDQVEPTSSPAPVAVATPEPSLAPSQQPTPPPTPTPTPVPEPTITGDALDMLLFSGHALGVLTQIQDFSERFSTDITDFAAQLDYYVAMSEELTWLEANPPAPCYAPIWNAYKAAIESNYRVADMMTDLDYEAALDELPRAIELMNTFSSVVEATSPTVCAP